MQPFDVELASTIKQKCLGSRAFFDYPELYMAVETASAEDSRQLRDSGDHSIISLCH